MCSSNQWDAQKLQHLQSVLVNRMGPVLLHNSAQPHISQPMLQKLNKLAYEVLLHQSYSPDLSQTTYYFSKHLNDFLQVTCFHNQQGIRKCFSRVCWIPQHGFVYYRSIKIYLLMAKICWLQWFTFWLIKMCLNLVKII